MLAVDSGESSLLMSDHRVIASPDIESPEFSNRVSETISALSLLAAAPGIL